MRRYADASAPAAQKSETSEAAARSGGSATAAGQIIKGERRRQAERSETTRQALINAAIVVLNERGYTGATAALIAAEAGVTRGALQHHFGTLQDLFVAVMRHVSRDRSGMLKAEIPPAGSLDERMQLLADQYHLLYEGPDAIALLEIWLGAGHDEELRQQIDALMRRITERRNDYWRIVLADIGLPEQDIDTLRGALVSLLRGATIHRVFSHDRARASDQVRLFLDMTKIWLAQRRAANPERLEEPSS